VGIPRIAIVGLGGLFPDAPSPRDLFSLVQSARDALSEPPPGRWALSLEQAYRAGGPFPDRVDSRRAGFLAPFDVDLTGLNIDPALLPQLDPLFRLALRIGSDAWRSAVTAPLDRSRVGVILGSIALPTETTSAMTRAFLSEETPPHPLNRQVTGLPAALLARALGLTGGTLTLDAACASSLYAIKLAVDELVSGRADAMIAGGLSRPDSLYTQMGFTQLRAISPRGICSPFDTAADGLVVGEGGGAFVLKRLEDARRHGDRIWGVLCGIGLSNDREGGLLAPASEGQLRAMRAAYAQAGWSPDSVGLIECHATGTPVGDAVELESLQRLWQSASPAARAVLGSVKATIGHLLTGAGAAALTKVLFALNEGVLPPTANHRQPVAALRDSPFRVLQEPQRWDGPRRAAVSAFGFGGINAHMLICLDDEVVTAPPPKIPSQDEPIAVVAYAVREANGEAVEVPAGAFRIPPRELEEMLPQQALMLLAAHDAAQQADLTPQSGAWIGVSLDLNTTNFHARWAFPDRADTLGPALNANRTMGALASIAASRLAREFRLGGPCFTVSAGDAGGLRAVELGVRALQRGEVDAALVGAVDLRGDPREPQPGRNLAVALILRRAADARAEGQRILATIGDITVARHETDTDCTTGLHPLTGVASGTRIAFVSADRPLVEERLFVAEGETNEDIIIRLNQLHFDRPTRGTTATTGRAVALLARTPDELRHAIAAAAAHLREQPGVAARERFFYSPTPLKGSVAFTYPGSGNDFPGMARALLRRWPDIARRQRRESRRHDAQFPARPQSMEQRIAAQVTAGTVVSDVLLALGIRPQAAIGYSLGESSALFGLRAWTDRDGLFETMERSTLFKSDLCGPCDVARRVWGVEQVDWVTAVIERSGDEIRAALPERAYLQFIHGPRECVVGGDRAAVQELARRLGVDPVLVPTTTTMHCSLVRAVAEPYRTLHVWPIRDTGVSFYSSAWGRAYRLTSESAADAILAQATETVDFPRVIEAAYADGVRIFVEAGPGASVSRLVSQTLGDRPHAARSACVAGPDPLAALKRVVAMLIAERVAVNLDALAGEEEQAMVRVPLKMPFAPASLSATGAAPAASTPAQTVMPLGQAALAVETLHQLVAMESAKLAAHAAYLRNMTNIQNMFIFLIQSQTAMISHGACTKTTPANPTAGPVATGVVLDRNQCLTFAIGRIADVLGPAFAEIDTFPTRVRLPDEPLMLVDRIVALEGEPLSLTHGRVVTEHDIHPGAWYLDGGRIPTCLAVESGQADLFLSGYLGIDLRTRGLSVYRLLDAAVTFHRSLPGPGEVIRYDIHIDSFFRQDQTYLFRFRFVGTVNGEPLLTMSDGIAGFFSEQELAAGRGVVRTAMQNQPRPGVEPDDAAILPPLRETERYSEAQIDALRRGDLAGCFGPLFANVPLRQPMRLPGGRMRLVHRVMALEPRGGQYGIGRIVAEADIHPDDWFITCHFVDDQVMPGTLMFECCLHTLRIFLMRMGWIGEHDEVACEPKPGVRSRLKCRGQVTAHTKVVTYEVTLKERGYGPEPYAIVDALMYADGKPIVDIGDMSIRLSGLNQEKVAAVWQGHSPVAPPLFTREQILAYAIGNPSECFGPRYAAFDRQFLARLPGPPFAFVDRVVASDVEPFVMKAGGKLTAEYDVPPDAWYFASERTGAMPFCVLLEAALQVCGFTSCYIGSALTSDKPLHYRNLGGDAEILRDVTPDTGTLRTTVKVTRVAASGGMIIQDFDFDLGDRHGSIYRGKTTFGFFSPEALAQQVGLREGGPPELALSGGLPMPREAPFPDDMLRMMDRVAHLDEASGLIEGHKTVRPEEWFFQAHFYQDPVWPGSLGLEALLQLFKVLAHRRWGGNGFRLNQGRHRWTYRGQVLPTHKEVQVRGMVSTWDDTSRMLIGHGWLTVDGRTIYRMEDFRVQCVD
jgi:acyl transferase domain-containing protein/3-hydroxymyristoyl/3-hydroxydecanoyl-(acyl carrier protein) dehydratase